MNNDFLKPKKNKIEPITVLPQDESQLLDKVSTHEPGPEPILKTEEKEILSDKPKDPMTKKSRNPFVKFTTWFKGLSKKKKIIFCIVAVLVLAGITAGAVLALNKPKPAPVTQKAEVKVEEPVKTTEPSKLTGVEVPLEMNKRPVTGIMIENSPEARPQSGLKDAGVVFEAIAEGGITRFLTLFQEAQPDYIGPVRSVRPYYVDWAKGFDASLAHAGGSPDGLARLRTEGVPDLDQFANAGAFMRVNNRTAPHNLYTTMAKLDDLKKAKGFTSSTFEGFARKADKANPVPAAKSIDFSISSALYSVHYDYDATTNSYKRSEGGKPHLDLRSGAQLQPKVVIANVMTYTAAYNGVNGAYGTIGSGKANIFQDGEVIAATWSKSSTKSQIVWKDAAGAVIKMNPGQTWISAVNKDADIKYLP